MGFRLVSAILLGALMAVSAIAVATEATPTSTPSTAPAPAPATSADAQPATAPAAAPEPEQAATTEPAEAEEEEGAAIPNDSDPEALDPFGGVSMMPADPDPSIQQSLTLLNSTVAPATFRTLQ